MWVSSRQEYGVRSLVVAVFWHMAMYRFFNINLADVVLNRARNIDSQFGSEQRKAGRSVFFASSLRKKKRKKFASHISFHPFCPSSFVPSSLSIDLNVTQPWHGFSRLLAERVLYILFLLLRFYTISSATLFSASVSFFFFSQNVFPPLYVHLIEFEI